jgi:hypothetical protein
MEKKSLFTVIEFIILVVFFVSNSFAVVNNPPTISGLDTVITLINGGPEIGLFDLYELVSDAEDPDSNLTFVISNQTNRNLVNCYIDTNRYVSCDAPARNQVGKNTVTITVTDTQGASVSGWFDYYVLGLPETNNPPVLSGIPDFQFPMNTGSKPNLVDLWNYAADVEDRDEQLTFTILQQTNLSLMPCIINSNRYVSCNQPASNQTGTNTITVLVKDRNNAYSSDTFEITISNSGNSNTNAPTISNLPNINIRENSGSRERLINLFDYVSDSRNTDEQLRYEITNQTNQNLINCFVQSNQYISCDAPRPNQTGINTLTIKVTNTNNQSATATLAVYVNSYTGSRTPPSISGLGTYKIEENSPQQNRIIDLYRYSRDNEDSVSQLTYRITSQSNTNLINCRITDNRYISCDAPRQNSRGTSTIRVEVEDQDGQKDDDILTIEVTSGGFGICSDIRIITETVYMNEDDVETVTFKIMNRGMDDFIIEDVQTSDDSQYMRITDAQYDDIVEAGDEIDLDLEIETERSTISRDATGYIQISGRFDNGATCSFNDIGQTSFRVRINSGSSSSSSACSDIELDAKDIEIPENRVTSKEFTIFNNSTRDFDITNIEVSESSSYFSARIIDKPSSVDSDESEKIIVSFDAKQVSGDRTDTAKLRVSGRFSNGKTCSLSSISESFDVTVKDSSSTTPQQNLDNVILSTVPQLATLRVGESKQVLVNIINNTGTNQCFSFSASGNTVFSAESTKTTFCLENNQSDSIIVNLNGKKQGNGTMLTTLAYAGRIKEKPVLVEVQGTASQAEQILINISAPAEISGNGKITIQNNGKSLKNVKIAGYNFPEGVQTQSLTKNSFATGEKVEFEVKTNFNGKAEGVIRIESDEGIKNIPVSFESKQPQTSTGTGLLNLAVMAGTGIILLIVLGLAILGIINVIRRN